MRLSTQILSMAFMACCLGSSIPEAQTQEESPKLRALEKRRPVVEQALPKSSAPTPALADFVPAQVSAAQKKAIAQKIDAILGEKLLRNIDAGILIVDLESGQEIYSRQPTKALKPASNMKLLTTAAALGVLGPDYQFATQVYMDGKLEKNGTLKGDLLIDIDHDFTWSTRYYSSGDVPLRELLAQIKAAGIKRIDGKVVVGGRVVYGGKPTGSLNCSAHLASVAKRLRVLLKNQKLRANSVVTRTKLKPKGKIIATWLSPTLSEALVPINRVSHNEYADMLLMALGSYKEKKSNFEAGARVVKAWLEESGMQTKGLIIKDGSGLSHDNRVSAQLLVQVTKTMLTGPNASAWAASLSIAGHDGTYRGRLTGNETDGRVLVKSGTLRDVISGSGILVNAQDSRVYAFSLLANNMRNKKATRSALDRIVRTFSGDNLDLPIPPAVSMRSLLPDRKGGVVASWEKSGKAAGYRLWQSPNGQSAWQSVAQTTETSYRFEQNDKPLFVRVTAYSDKGAESLPSKVFGYQSGKQMLTLVEAATCRWDEQTRPINRLFAHDMALSAALPEGYGLQTTAPEALPEQNDVILWHGGVCQNRCDLQSNALKDAWIGKAPLILNYFDAHLLAPANARCNPDKGAIDACFTAPLVAMDRRIQECGANNRLRKAAGTGTTRPSIVGAWGDAKSCLSLQNASLASCSQGTKRAIIGFDLGALDSTQTQKAAIKQVFSAMGLL